MVGKTCNLLTSCPCGSKFDTQHSMSCMKGGLLYMRHNDLRDLTAKMMSEVCKDTKIKSKLTRLSREELHSRKGRTSNNSNEARPGLQVFKNEGNRHFST